MLRFRTTQIGLCKTRQHHKVRLKWGFYTLCVNSVSLRRNAEGQVHTAPKVNFRSVTDSSRTMKIEERNSFISLIGILEIKHWKLFFLVENFQLFYSILLMMNSLFSRNKQNFPISLIQMLTWDSELFYMWTQSVKISISSSRPENWLITSLSRDTNMKINEV